MSHIVDTIVSEGLMDTASYRVQTTVAATANTTTILTVASVSYMIYTGSTAGQIVRFGAATTYTVGHTYLFHNNSSVSISVQDGAATTLFTLVAGQRATIVLQNNSTTAGIWVYSLTGPAIAVNLSSKTGTIASGSFTGNPKTAAVTFSTAFANTNYSISITGVDARQWSWSSKATTGFTISSNANGALTGNVDWQAMAIGESA